MQNCLLCHRARSLHATVAARRTRVCSQSKALQAVSPRQHAAPHTERSTRTRMRLPPESPHCRHHASREATGRSRSRAAQPEDQAGGPPDADPRPASSIRSRPRQTAASPQPWPLPAFSLLTKSAAKYIHTSPLGSMARRCSSRDAGAAAVLAAVCAVAAAGRVGGAALASGADGGAWPHDWGANARRALLLSPPRAGLSAALRLRGSGPQESEAAGKAPDDAAPIDPQAYADANLWVKRQMAALEERKKQVPRAWSRSRFPRPARVRAAAARKSVAPRGPTFDPLVRTPAPDARRAATAQERAA